MQRVTNNNTNKAPPTNINTTICSESKSLKLKSNPSLSSSSSFSIDSNLLLSFP